MYHKILLTSFDTWLPHHTSNSSDDLLNIIYQLNYQILSLNFLKKLPVDVTIASDHVINKINEIQPNSIICCGMAERRNQLSVESNARWENKVLINPIDLQKLLADTKAIDISHDAGRFVCEGLYYYILKYISDRKLNMNCIFVHVPILTKENSAGILTDFQTIIHRIGMIST